MITAMQLQKEGANLDEANHIDTKLEKALGVHQLSTSDQS